MPDTHPPGDHSRGQRMRSPVLVTVLGVVAAVCLAATAVVVWYGPIGWFIRGTAEAGKGEASPEAAVNIYLLQLNAREEDGLRRVLADDQREELLRQWREYRAGIESSEREGGSYRLTWPGYETAAGEDQAVVVVQVAGQWRENTTSWRGTPYPWRFHVRDDGGWRVDQVEAYPWCGGHVRAEACRR